MRMIPIIRTAGDDAKVRRKIVRMIRIIGTIRILVSLSYVSYLYAFLFMLSLIPCKNNINFWG